MKRYEALIALVCIILALVLVYKYSSIRIENALKEASKCEILLDHACLEYGKCKCKE